LEVGHIVIESSSLESVSQYFDSKPTDYPDLLAWMVASNAAERDTPGKRLEDRVKSLTEAATFGFRALLSTAQTPDETAINAAFSKLDSLNGVLGWCYPHGLGALITPLRELSALLRDFWNSHFYQIYLSPQTFTPQLLPCDGHTTEHPAFESILSALTVTFAQGVIQDVVGFVIRVEGSAGCEFFLDWGKQSGSPRRQPERQTFLSMLGGYCALHDVVVERYTTLLDYHLADRDTGSYQNNLLLGAFDCLVSNPKTLHLAVQMLKNSPLLGRSENRLEKVIFSGCEPSLLIPVKEMLRFAVDAREDELRILFKGQSLSDEERVRWRYLLGESTQGSSIQRSSWSIGDHFVVRPGLTPRDEECITVGAGGNTSLNSLSESFIIEQPGSRLPVGGAWGFLRTTRDRTQLGIRMPYVKSWQPGHGATTYDAMLALVAGAAEYAQRRYPGEPMILSLNPLAVHRALGEKPFLGYRADELFDL
jgi:hypothetical protein